MPPVSTRRTAAGSGEVAGAVTSGGGTVAEVSGRGRNDVGVVGSGGWTVFVDAWIASEPGSQEESDVLSYL